MENRQLGQHISGQFNQELEDIRNQVMAMGGLVEQQLSRALDVLHTGDSALAEKVASKDRKVNKMEVSVDEACTQIIALRQPAASDLRLVLSISKAVSDIERIGDSSVRIARLAMKHQINRDQGMVVAIEAMGRNIQRLLHDVLDAFARMDVEAAMRLHQADTKVDSDFEAVVRQQMTFMMEDPRSIPQVLDILWAARALERIGDHCQNICEYVVYYVKGQDIRHMDIEEIEELLK